VSHYTAPIRDVFFSLAEVNDFAAHYQYMLSESSYGFDDLEAALPEIGRFASEVLAPLNAIGDAEGARCEHGKVSSPAGFSAAYRQYVDGAWPTLAQPEAFGGMPLPFSAKIAAGEFLQSANQSWCMYTALNDGAIKCLINFATPDLLARYVPKLVSGEWLATMCLTESQCGSDLNLLTSRAEPTASGSYLITGTKIFISSGDHDFTNNIVHLVLARLPNAPAGTRGISLFVVPKRHINDDGSLGEANKLSCLSVEHKMGLKGSATCVMAFDGAEGWLVGEANRGLQNMFVFINKSRLGVGQQAQGQIEAAYQTSLAYAHERRAGRAPSGAIDPEQGADALIHQPDIRRMLMSQKAIAEGGRALIHWCAKCVDISDLGNAAEQREAEQLLGLLIPITKGCLSELASEMTDYGVQILGGHGYVSEWGLEQRVRDVRVTRIYEGTTGIQGIDLLARKILGRGRPAFQRLTDIMLAACGDDISETVKPLQDQLAQAICQWCELTDDLEAQAQQSNSLLPAIAVDYLMIAGYISLAYMWLKAATVAENTLAAGQTTEADFYRAKLQTARFYFDKILPRIELHKAVINKGDDALDCDIALALQF
jgi:alkylation response protein AidB-like acyl-CoA dehydrogenase